MASAEGINPDILYNFNENNSTVIRDYSEKGNDGTGANLTVSATDRTVGYDAVFNGTTSQINRTISSIDDSLTISLAIKLQANTGTDYIFDVDFQEFYCTWDGSTLTFTLDTDEGTFSLGQSLDVDTWYDIVLKLDDDTGKMYFIVNGVELAQLAVTGSFNLTNPTIDIGNSGSGNYGKFLLNEFKLFQNQDTTTIDDGFITEQNGVFMTSNNENKFALGDIIGTNIGLSVSSFAIVTFVDGLLDYRIQPISGNLGNGNVFTRCGHLWDTTRQWMFIIDKTPQICFYDGISNTSEVYTEAKKTYCIGLSGSSSPYLTKTANYTIVANDSLIDCTANTFTVTLPTAVGASGKAYTIINSGSGTITLATTSSQTIGNGTYSTGLPFDATTQTIAQGEVLNVMSNGANWRLNA